MLVVQTIAAPPRPARGRRRPRQAEAAAAPPEVPLARATAIRAFEPFEDAAGAGRWLAAVTASEDAVDAAVDSGVALLNDALHAHAVASADPYLGAVSPERAVAVRLGYGSGEETAAGAFTEAAEVDVTGGTSRRRRRQEELRPQERVAAVLRGNERFAACEPLLLRARLDLDAGRTREAALQLGVAVPALLAELPGALDDPDHDRDIATLEDLQRSVRSAADQALQGDVSPEAATSVRDALSLAERILRRRRLLSP